MSSDLGVLDGWWRQFARSGEAGPELTLVQTRLIRSVHRGTLPSGEVFVKTMTFPRAKDRLRYLLRPLPAEHEATALRTTRAAGLPCPEVLDVRTARRFGLPFRSWLVLRALPVDATAEVPAERLRDESALALRMLAAGIEHRDLHQENFVRLSSGELAVLDMQSTTLHGTSLVETRHRLDAAARLVRDLVPEIEVEPALLAGGLLRNPAEVAAVVAAAARQRQDYRRGRVWRCLRESTEFQRLVRWSGIEYRHRGPLPPGRWLWGRREQRRRWLGQRAQQLFGSRYPVFSAYFQKWWWLGGAAGLYVPQTCSEDRIEAELEAAITGFTQRIQRDEIREEGADGEG